MSTKETNISTEPSVHQGNISGCLHRMISDAEEIEKRLLEAPGDLVGERESELHKVMNKIKEHLEEAKKIWRL